MSQVVRATIFILTLFCVDMVASRDAHAAPQLVSINGTTCSMVLYLNGWARVVLNSKSDCTGNQTQIYVCSFSGKGMGGCGAHNDDFADATYNALIIALREHIAARQYFFASCWNDTNTCPQLTFTSS